MSKRIIMYRGQIPELDLFSEELARGFEALGAEVFFYDINKKNSDELTAFCSRKTDAVVTFNTMFYNMQAADGQNAWKKLDIPYMTILVDNPVNFAATLDKMERKDSVLCVDREHCRYVSRFFGNVGHVGFLPHGGTAVAGGNDLCGFTAAGAASDCTAAGGNAIRFEDRKMDILYAGGIPLKDCSHIEIPEQLFSKYNGIFDVGKVTTDIVRLCIENHDETIEHIIEAYMSILCGGPLDEDSLRMMTVDFSFIHAFVLSFYRAEILRSAAESGRQLYIYGNDYSGFPFAQKNNVHLMGKVQPAQILELMKDAKIVLSTMAWFKDGSHERIFNGMAAGAVVLTESGRYIEECFETAENERQELYSFSLNDIAQIPDTIDRIIEHPEHSEKVIANAYEAVEKHTWTCRAKELYEMI